MPNPDWFPKPPTTKPLPIGLAVLLLVIGAACLAWGGHDLFLAAASQRWPVAQGAVLSAETGSTTSKSYDRGRIGNKTITRTSSAPVVSYHYQVGDGQFQGDRIFIGEGFHMSNAAAATLIARYPVGQQVTVYYDLQHPERSVLEPGIRTRNWSAAIVGAVFLFVGWPALFGRFRATSRPPTP